MFQNDKTSGERGEGDLQALFLEPFESAQLSSGEPGGSGKEQSMPEEGRRQPEERLSELGLYKLREGLGLHQDSLGYCSS